ncbi:MAG: RNase H family protein [Mariprofundaceae bacterium]|nr:RNase H family protein [Mariprofundaceae bacterium]
MDEDNEYSAVMYTDGSCVPSGRWPAGGGCHGYLYTADDYRKNGDKPNHYTVTDKGYLEKHELGPHAKIVKPTLYYNAVYPYGTNSTNNRAELLAVIDTVNILTAELKLSRIDIYTDSMYVINVHKMLCKDLVTKSWRSADKPNMDLWEELVDMLNAIGTLTLTINKVKAHGTAIGNNVADRLAYAAREMADQDVTTKIHRLYKGKYWKDKVTPHPLFNFKQIYFNLGITADTGEYLYVIMDHPKDVETGKKSPTPLFGISVTKEPVERLGKVIDTCKRTAKGNHYLTAINLGVVYSQEHLKMTELLDTHAYSVAKGGRVTLLGEANVAVPITPPGLAQGALIRTLDMYKLYKTCVGKEDTDDGVVKILDITTQLYTVTDKGKLLLKAGQDVPGPVVQVTLSGKVIDIPLVYGNDILSRNQLLKLGAGNATIRLVVNRYDAKSFEYYILVETDGVSGIYGNYYINKVFL